jgi:DNA-directed RNA polymerase subunit RPC12/RpoP
LGIDFLDRYWDYNKNTISPWDITNQYRRKVWIKCDKNVGHESYDVECPSFHSGARCPYCSHTRLSIENSLVERYPKSIEVWSSKNSTSPQDFSYASGKKAWWKCPSGKHQDFYRAISDSAIVCEFRCPKCYAKGEVSNIQKKVCEILDSTGYTILHESNCTISPISPYTGRKLRYDNQVLELSIIVEVHGEQHYKPHSFSTTPCDIETMNKKLTDYQKRDKFKKEYALSHGFSYLEIPYYDIRNGKYIQLIEDAIESAKYKISIIPLDESSGFLFEESLVVI